jgi:hypothetical protein
MTAIWFVILFYIIIHNGMKIVKFRNKTIFIANDKTQMKNLNCKPCTGLFVQYTQFWTRNLVFHNVFHVPILKLKQVFEYDTLYGVIHI